ncbi:LysR family transcriptional regulator [Photobacterium damselae]|uniref:HTH lysR-type domain-containing protein n=2 Tax=Photobacterium damselae TaxID=38293 RepID=D0Z3K5_PHODD|nr:LysR family transcriptional regulator [Photobacterium damselae]EEZ39986.1 hypothetical protein VDA_001006 [Photobacterium damselae subsp. damselae CIP 102761]PSW84533.1 LysR family transcriptional regulator [Photobacterium damselae]SPY44138.1 HTH-type transcriptional activator CmpR [Photobacterium damselae]
MKLSQLNAFKAVVECQTVTAAAERLNLSQPAVSRLLSALEDRLGFTLFVRSRNRLVLSVEGEAFYLEVAKVFEAVSDLDNVATSIRTNHFGSLHLAAMPLLSNAFLPRILAHFLKQTNQLKVGFKTYRSEEIIRRVQSQVVDIGFAFLPDTQPLPGVKAQRVECQCVAIVPIHSPLAHKSYLYLDDIADQLVIRHEKDTVQQRIDSLLQRHDLRTIEHIEVSLASTAAALVQEGIGMAITDPLTAYMSSEHTNVLTKPLNFHLPFEFDILYPAFKPIHRHAEVFIEQFMLQADAMDIQLKIGPMRDLNEY